VSTARERVPAALPDRVADALWPHKPPRKKAGGSAASETTTKLKMSKTTITWLFGAAVAAVVAGTVIRVAAVVAGLADGAVALGGPQVVTLNGDALAWSIAALVMASLLIAAGAVAAIASWFGALLNASRLEDQTWFAVLLVLGLVSLGWVAVVAYVVAGPDSTPRDATHSAVTGQKAIARQAARRYTWCRPPRRGLALIGPCPGRVAGQGVSSPSVRCGRSRL
jgi:hypothetical protein